MRTTALLLAHAAPAALALFLLFPRVQGPLWGLPQDAYAGMTGLSDTMSPGTLSSLALSDAIAFRAEFHGALAAAALRYWRGPVLWDFDGRSWSIGPSFLIDFAPPRGGSASYRYEIVLEPHNRHWLFALETAASLPERRAHEPRRPDHGERAGAHAHALRAVSVIAPEAQLTKRRGRAPRAAPARGLQPARSALAAQWRAASADDAEVVARAVGFLRQGSYAYTLEPPLLGEHSVDEFLFSTKAGFCEHFASAFVFLMRAAGVPARVVTGYQGGELNPVDSIITVRQSDAHAWAEVLLRAAAGCGSTRPRPRCRPPRVGHGARGAPGRACRSSCARSSSGCAACATAGRPWRTSGTSGFSATTRAAARPHGELRHARRRLAHAHRDALHRARHDDARSARLVAQAPGAPRSGAAGVARLLPQARARGVERAPSEGPRDYAARAARALPAARRSILRIGALYIALRYGAQATPPALTRLRKLVREF